jgi:hypothetical protein
LGFARGTPKGSRKRDSCWCGAVSSNLNRSPSLSPCALLFFWEVRGGGGKGKTASYELLCTSNCSFINRFYLSSGSAVRAASVAKKKKKILALGVNKILDGGFPAAYTLDPPTCRALRTPVRVCDSRCKIPRRWRGLVLGCNVVTLQGAIHPPFSLSLCPMSSVQKGPKKIARARPH